MKASRLDNFTSLDDLRLRDENDPRPQRGEVLRPRPPSTSAHRDAFQTTGHRVWSVCLLNLPHVFFRHAATMNFDFSESSFDLTKIRRCKLNINCS